MKRKIFLLGCGTIGKCVLDILVYDKKYIKKMTGFDISISEILVFDKVFTDTIHANGLIQVQYIKHVLKRKTLNKLFSTYGLNKNDVVIDLTSCTGTRDIVKQVAVVFGACYICTALEGWNGLMYPMQEMVKHVGSLKKYLPSGSPTVLLTHGMNPGMVSHFVLLGLDHFSSIDKKFIKTVHITEIDTQILPKNGKGVVAVPTLTVTRPNMAKNILSTWGPQNFVDEMNAKPHYVESSRTTVGTRRAFNTERESKIYDPVQNHVVPFKGHIVTHEESFTINNFLKSKGYGRRREVSFLYKPTEPSLKSFLKSGHAMKRGERKGLLLKGKGVKGFDTVGIYMESETGKSIWVGNSCEAGFAPNEQVRKRYHNATTLQVAAGVLSAFYVICKNGKLGLRYPEDIPRSLRDNLLPFSERYYGKIIVKELN